MGKAEETRTIEQVVQRTGCSFRFVPVSIWDLKPEQSEHENMNNAVKMTVCIYYFGGMETTIPKTKGSGFLCAKELVFTIVIPKPSLTGRSVQGLPCVLTPARVQILALLFAGFWSLKSVTFSSGEKGVKKQTSLETPGRLKMIQEGLLCSSRGQSLVFNSLHLSSMKPLL